MRQDTVLATRPFSIEKMRLADPNQREVDYYRFLCPDWVNILPLTQDGQCILIKQFRAGVLRDVWEVPGGVCDQSDGGSLAFSAVRELEEETGYTSADVIHLASINANPAIQSNRVHYFIARDCFLANPRRHFPDDEEFIEVKAVPLPLIGDWLKNGRIDHSYAYLAVLLGLRYLGGQ